MLSERAKSIPDSPTLAISARAKELKAQGRDIVDLGAGQPDFPPPDRLRQEVCRAASEDDAGYTPSSGLPELRQAVCEKLKRENGVECSPAEVIITAGAKQALFNLFQAVLNPGDEVIIPKPYWVSYPEMVRLAGGVPLFSEPGEGFSLDMDSIKQGCTEKTRAIILNSPGNPSGTVASRKAIEELAGFCQERGVLLVSDEIYEKLIYEGEHVSPASLSEGIRGLTFTVNGLSKSHAIPGWRIGYCAGPEEAIKAMGRLQSQSTSNACSIVQRAAINALRGDYNPRGIMEGLRERRDFLVRELNTMEGFSCTAPGGAFYVFPSIPQQEDLGFCRRLLEEAGVAAVPGSAFGMPGHIRLSYTETMERLEEGCRRLADFAGDYSA